MFPQDAIDKTLRALIVSEDRTLEDEFRLSLSGVPDAMVVVHLADSYRQALEVARGRQPNLVLIDLDRDASEVAALSKELHELVPGVAIACAYRLSRFENGQAESTALIDLIRAHVRDFIRRPLATTEVRAVLERLFATVSAPSSPTRRGRVFAFLGSGGGVGKSTLAVNAACALALRHPDEVLLVDAAMQGGTCAMMLDLRATTGIVDAVRERDRLDGTLLRHLTIKHGTGLRLLASPGDALEGADVDEEAASRILNLARRSFKYVVVDTSATIDGVVTTLLDMTDSAFVVLRATAPSVAGAVRLLPVLEGLGVPAVRQRIVLNGSQPSFLGELRASDIGDRLQRTVDHVVPYDKRVLASMNTGVPQIIHAARWHGFRRAILALADDLDAAAPLAPSGGDAEPAVERAGAARAGR